MENRYIEQPRGTEVRVRYTGNTPQERDKDLEKALAQFKKLVNREGILVELREREYFRSPAEKLRAKRKKAIQRLRAKEKKKHFKKDFKNDKDKRNDFRK